MMAVLFFAVPPTMNPMNRRMLPQMMNQRRPNKSELAPQILENISEYQGLFPVCINLHECQCDCHCVYRDIPRSLSRVSELRRDTTLA